MEFFKKVLLRTLNVSMRPILTEEEIDKLLTSNRTKQLEKKIFAGLAKSIHTGSMYSVPIMNAIAKDINLLKYLYTEKKIESNSILYILYVLDRMASGDSYDGSLEDKERFLSRLPKIKDGASIECEYVDVDEDFKILVLKNQELFKADIKIINSEEEREVDNIHYFEIFRSMKRAS